MAIEAIACFIGGVLAFAFLYFKSSKQCHLPPSPPGALPIIGHMHLLGKNPHQSLFTLAKKHGSLMHLRLGTVGTLVVSSPEEAKQVLKEHDLVFAQRTLISAAEFFGYNGKDMVFSPYGDYWKNLRKLCISEVLSAGKVEMFKPLRKLELSILIEELLLAGKKNSPIILRNNLSNLMFNIMTRIVMNKSFSKGTSTRDERESALAFKEAFSQTLALGSGFNLGDFFPFLRCMDVHIPELRKSHKRLDGYLQKEVDEHKKYNCNQGDLIGTMLSVGHLNDITVKALALDMISGGTDTAALAVEWGMAELLKNPHTFKKLQKELYRVIGKDRLLEESDIPSLKYLQAVTKETFRLHPPAAILPRESREACIIGGYGIPAKTRVMVNVYAIGRDAKVWSEPEIFDPERFLIPENTATDVTGRSFQFLPFGAGRRMCPGLPMGVLPVQYTLGTLVHAFDWQLAGDPFEMDMDDAFGLVVMKANPLSLVPSPRLSMYLTI